MSTQKSKIEHKNYDLNMKNFNNNNDNNSSNKIKRKRNNCDVHDCFRIELLKPISSKKISMNFDSIFRSSNKTKKDYCNKDSGRLVPNDFVKQNFLAVNISDLNLIKKENLLFLIEKNFSRGIKCPFDLYAYTRLSRIKPGSKFEEKNLFNNFKVNKTSELLSNCENNPLDARFLRNSSLLACTLGSFLMPFYFDIFKVSELNEFSPIEIDMVLALKKNYKANVYLNYHSLISNYKDEILWNCLIIYKYKLDDAKKFQSNRFEFLNYFLAMMFNLCHLENVVNCLQKKFPRESEILKIHVIKALELSAMIPLLLEALILTGLFKHKDFIVYEHFATDKLNYLFQKCEYNIEKTYYANTLNMVRQKCEQVFPLKLSNLCRITLRSLITNCNQNNVKKLPCSSEAKKFILYQNELRNSFDKYKYCRF